MGSSGASCGAFDGEKEDDGKITLSVRGLEGAETPVFSFTMKRDETFLELKTAYCKSRKLSDHKQVAFICNARRACCRHTPDDFQLQDGDVIDAMLHQKGC